MRYLLVTLVLMIWLPLMSDLRNQLEGYFFPVVGELEVTDTYDILLGTSVVGSAEKFRSCSYKKTLWYLGKRDDLRDPVVIIHRDKPQVRKPGFLSWDNIEVHLPSKDVLTRSHADVVHECTFLGFKRDVISRFYTSP